MRISSRRFPRRARPLAAMMRPGTILGCACLCTISTLIGCQTVSRDPALAKQNAATHQDAKADAGVARTEFRRDVTPDQQFNVHLELGRVYESQQEFTAALGEYQKALEACERRGFGTGMKGIGTKQALAHRRIGGVLDRLGRFAQSEDHYRLALKASPDDSKVWNDAGYSYYLQRRWADAERNLKTAAKLAPDDVRIQTNLGLTLAAMDKTDEALLALSKAGGTAIAHANLGYLLAAMGKKEEAKAHYRTAIELQPNLAPARQALTALDTDALKAEQVASTVPLPTRTPTPTSTATVLPASASATTTPIPLPNRPATPTSVPVSASTSRTITYPSAAVTSSIPQPKRVADPSVRRTTGPRATPLSVSPLPPLATTPR